MPHVRAGSPARAPVRPSLVRPSTGILALTGRTRPTLLPDCSAPKPTRRDLRCASPRKLPLRLGGRRRDGALRRGASQHRVLGVHVPALPPRRAQRLPVRTHQVRNPPAKPPLVARALGWIPLCNTLDFAIVWVSNQLDSSWTVRTALPHLGSPTILKLNAGFAVQISQLWSGTEPGLTRLVSSKRLRQS
jgi:hypothetical protein